MRLNTLRPAPGSKQKATRVGRGMGSGLGKTAGRGHKGQKARAGGSVKPGFEGGQMPIQRRLPKFGFSTMISRRTAEVRLSELAKVDADVIDLATLKAVSVVRGNMTRAKVVLSGTINKAITLKGIAVTAGARAAIEAAGGKVEA
jgi:large subunit ribosomal protein L15